MVSKTKLCTVQHLFTLFFRVDPPTFYPTLEEFSNLTKYVEYMESQGAHRYNFLLGRFDIHKGKNLQGGNLQDCSSKRMGSTAGGLQPC